MRSAYRVIAGLISLGVVVQAASIAYAMFAIAHEVDNGTVIDKNYVEHSTGAEGLGFAIHAIDGQLVIPLLALVLLVVSFFAKVAGGVKWAAFTFLAVVVQVVLAFVSFGAPVAGFLHGLNALTVFSLGVFAARKAAAPATEPVVAATTAPATV
ncbi:MAG TPA: hypothetical protein VHO27_17100 [Angustibacter sp.]|nr:hypothetical protein [Angustibacter sp.]